FVKFEAKHMRRASRFIVNSETSRRDLLTLYADVASGKEIDYIPVSSSLKKQDFPSLVEESGLYFHGRYHPQKGLHFLLQQDWQDLQLTLRGFEESFLNPETIKCLRSKGINAFPWTFASSLIHRLIMEHELLLFPPVYEPWVLS